MALTCLQTVMVLLVKSLQNVCGHWTRPIASQDTNGSDVVLFGAVGGRLVLGAQGISWALLLDWPAIQALEEVLFFQEHGEPQMALGVAGLELDGRGHIEEAQIQVEEGRGFT